MTMTLQEISDRLEIAEIVHRYAYGLDQHLWSEWDRVFTHDAVIDYSHWGMDPCGPDELRAFLAKVHEGFASSQHIVTNQIIWLDGDTARSRIEYFVSGLLAADTGAVADVIHSGGWYEDELRHTDAGWRIIHRRAVETWGERDRVPSPNQ